MATINGKALQSFQISETYQLGDLIELKSEILGNMEIRGLRNMVPRTRGGDAWGRMEDIKPTPKIRVQFDPDTGSEKAMDTIFHGQIGSAGGTGFIGALARQFIIEIPDTSSVSTSGLTISGVVDIEEAELTIDHETGRAMLLVLLSSAGEAWTILDTVNAP